MNIFSKLERLFSTGLSEFRRVFGGYPLVWVGLYVLIHVSVVSVSVSRYDFRLSSLVGFSEDFAELNSEFMEEGFVVYDSGGYDGEFFYFLSRYLENSDLGQPILDSYSFRFHRIGLPLILAGLGKWIGFQWYPFLTLLCLNFFFIWSYLLLRERLNGTYKYLSVFYLLSPFAFDSTMLLVSDTLAISFSVLGIVYWDRGVGGVFGEERSSHWGGCVLGLLFLTASIFVRETTIAWTAPLWLWYFLRKRWREVCLLAIPVLAFLIFFGGTRFLNVENPGTNPRHFTEMIGIPFLGWLQSWSVWEKARLVKVIPNLPLFLWMIGVIFNIGNIMRTKRDWELYLPFAFLLFVPLVAIEEYWLTFDNIVRMFCLVLPWAIVLQSRFAEKYKNYGLFWTSLLIFGFLLFRFLFWKAPMAYHIFGG